MYRMLEYRTKRYLKYQNIHIFILLFLLRRFSQSLASQYGKPFLLKGNFIIELKKTALNTAQLYLFSTTIYAYFIRIGKMHSYIRYSALLPYTVNAKLIQLK